jgi:hypothetical protein
VVLQDDLVRNWKVVLVASFLVVFLLFLVEFSIIDLFPFIIFSLVTLS